MNPAEAKIHTSSAALLIVDIQERLAAAMPAQRMQMLIKGTRALVEMARRFSIPVVVSQQYPKGLGQTVPELEEALSGLESLYRFDKTEFSVCLNAAFDEVGGKLQPDQWIVVGMESHVCVYQSVRDLLERSASSRAIEGQRGHVFVACDALASRTEDNRATGIAMMERCGAIPTSSETVIFDVLERAGSDDFKALSKLIR